MTSPLITVVALTVLFLLLSTPVRSFDLPTTSDDSQGSRKDVHGALELTQAPTSVPACDAGTVSFTLLPGPRTCALPFEAYLVTTDPRGDCPLSATALTICDEFEQHCGTCVQNTQTALGILFTCLPLNSAGVQIVTANFSFGPLQNQLAQSDTFSCPPPPDCPTNNIRVSARAVLEDQACFNQVVISELVPIPGCRLVAGDILVCRGFGVTQCAGCGNQSIVSAVPSEIEFTCLPPDFTAEKSFVPFGYGSNLNQLITPFFFGCPVSPPHVPPIAPPPISPVSPPVAPPITPPPAGCDSSTVQFNLLPGPLQCGQNFQAILNTTVSVPGCPLASSGLSVCDTNRANCVQCP